MYELIVVWADGSTDVYEYGTLAQAETAKRGMEVANGSQISWTGTRRKI